MATTTSTTTTPHQVPGRAAYNGASKVQLI